MAVTLKTGTRDCGLNFFTATDTDWNLMGTTGGRTWTETITYGTPFTTTPTVQVGIAAFYLLEGGGSPKLHVSAAAITTSSFRLEIHTWDETQVAGVKINWIAWTP